VNGARSVLGSYGVRERAPALDSGGKPPHSRKRPATRDATAYLLMSEQ
jgi:hypothetical protein